MNSEPQPKLESWKEIAAYLQRDVKTAHRWEKHEGLPIHRHTHKSRSSVYAHAAEIDAWKLSRKAVREPVPSPSLWRVPTFALTILMCLVMVGNGIRPQAASAQEGKAGVKRILVPKGKLQYLTLSPDGQWLGGTDWNSGDLVLTRTSSGETRRLVQGHFNDDPVSWAQSPLLSPDQKQVAYWWYDYADPQAHGQVRLMANQPGAKPRVLVQATDGPDGTMPIAWSPDGKRMLVNLGRREEGQPIHEIAWATVSDGSVQVIRKLERWNSARNYSFVLSPDGRYIAYSGRMGPDAPDTAIYVFSADGASQAEIVRGGSNVDPVWTPDGSRILFGSNRSGSFGLWSAPVREGKPAGVPSLLRPDTSIARPIGVSRTGRYFYNAHPGLRQIFIAPMDPGTGKATPGVPESFVGEAPTWSLDGKWLAFKRQSLNSDSQRSLVVRSGERGNEWTLVPNLSDDAPLWHRNGTVQFDGSKRRVSVDSGQPEVVTIPFQVPSGVPSPDEKLLYRRPNGTTEGLEALDAVTGEVAKKMFPVPGGVIFFTVSPDGKTLAVISGGSPILHLSRIDTDGSNYRELISPVSLGRPVWSHDGRWIYFGQPQQSSTAERILRIPSEGGQLESTGISIDDLRGFDVNSEGTKIAYSGGSKTLEVWAIDNVLSILK